MKSNRFFTVSERTNSHARAIWSICGCVARHHRALDVRFRIHRGRVRAYDVPDASDILYTVPYPSHKTCKSTTTKRCPAERLPAESGVR